MQSFTPTRNKWKGLCNFNIYVFS